MELPDQVESLDAVPEPFRRFYAEADEGFSLDEDGFTGAVRNYDSLLGEKKKAAARIKEYEQKLKAFDGIEDPEEARKAAEELRKLKDQLAAKDAGTTDEEVEKLLKARTQRMMEDHQATLTAKDKALKERDDQLSKLNDELANRVIDSEVALAASSADGFMPQAVEDAVMHARRIFKLEDGKAVPRDADGQLMLGKDGEKPLTIKEWLESTKSRKDIWWKANANGGGATASEGEGGSKRISRKALDALPPDQRMAKMREGFQVTD